MIGKAISATVTATVYDGFKRMVLEVEARNIIMDQAVFNTVDAVTREFRIAYVIFTYLFVIVD